MQNIKVLRNANFDWTKTDQSNDWNAINYIVVASKYTQGTLIRSKLLLSDARRTFPAETGSQAVPYKSGRGRRLLQSWIWEPRKKSLLELRAQYYRTPRPSGHGTTDRRESDQVLYVPGKCFSL